MSDQRVQDGAPLLGALDADAVRTLARLAEELGLAELEVRDGARSLRVRRAVAEVAADAASVPTRAVQPAAAAPVAPAALAAMAAPSVQVAPAPIASAAPGTVLLRAPMAGTFYRAPAPGQPVFVDVGSAVEPQTVVCIIESMKMMNRIEAERFGRVQSVLVQNGARVQVGQPLFALGE